MEGEVFDMGRARRHPKLVETIRAKLPDGSSVSELGTITGGVYEEVAQRCLLDGQELAIEGEDGTGGGVVQTL